MKYSKHKLRKYYKIWLDKYNKYLLDDNPNMVYLCYDSKLEKFFISLNIKNLEAFNLTYESLIKYNDLRITDIKKY